MTGCGCELGGENAPRAPLACAAVSAGGGGRQKGEGEEKKHSSFKFLVGCSEAKRRPGRHPSPSPC